MDQGRLRDGVRVAVVGGEVIVRHRFVELALPRTWVDANPEIKAVLNREIDIDQLASEDNQLKGVVQFLELQDCFFRSRAKPEYSLEEIKDIFEPIARSWFAHYYSHPVWSKLRRGELNLNGFVAWVIHNYHVSRAAGRSGSRCAVLFPKQELRSFFRSDVLEEYWHCDAFYFVRHPALSISDFDVKSYVPLPASLAFEQYTVTVSETDWLAHLLISYFQESSIRFYSDCQEFYRDVEISYQLPGFFKTWTDHMRLDFEHGHADNFAEIFSSPETVRHETFVNSLSATWFAFSFLYSALGQIDTEATRSAAVKLRNPIRGGITDSSLNALCPFSGELKATSFYELAREIVSYTKPCEHLMEANAVLTNGVVEALFYSMSFAVNHDDIITVGKLIEAFPPSGAVKPEQGVSGSAMAIASFLRATAVHTKSLLFLIQLSIILGCKWATPESSARARLEIFLKTSSVLNSDDRDQCSTLALQWSELLEWHANKNDTCPSMEI